MMDEYADCDPAIQGSDYSPNCSDNPVQPSVMNSMLSRSVYYVEEAELVVGVAAITIVCCRLWP